MSENNQFGIERLIDIETERSLLHALMAFDTEEADLALIRIKEEHFFDEGNKKVFGIMRELSERHFDIDVEVVRAEVRKVDRGLEKSLLDIVCSEPISTLSFAVDALEEWRKKRELRRAALTLLDGVYSGESSYACASHASQIMDEATLSSEDDFESYAALNRKYENAPPMEKIPTGIPFLDSYLNGGLEEAKLMLMFGDPESGKTLLSNQIGRNMSRDHRVMFFPFEFSSRSFLEQNKRHEFYTNGKPKINQDNIFVDDVSTDLTDLAIKLKIFAKRGGKLAVIDSQMMITNIGNKGTSEERETEKFTTLGRIGIKYGLRIIFICQQGKEDTRSGIVTPMKSKNGAHAAHIIAYIETPKPVFGKDGEITNKNERFLHIKKNKQTGKHGKKAIGLDFKSLEFSGRHLREGAGRPKTTEVIYEMEDTSGNVSALEDPNLWEKQDAYADNVSMTKV